MSKKIDALLSRWHKKMWKDRCTCGHPRRWHRYDFCSRVRCRCLHFKEAKDAAL